MAKITSSAAPVSAPVSDAVVTDVAASDAPVAAPVRDGKQKREKKAKKEKVEKVAYEGDKIELASALPSDYDPSKHKPLKRTNFASEHEFLRYKAGQFEAVAVRMRKNADELEKLGGGSAGGKAKKVLSMFHKIQELAKVLGDDVNLEEMLGADVAKAIRG